MKSSSTGCIKSDGKRKTPVMLPEAVYAQENIVVKGILLKVILHLYNFNIQQKESYAKSIILIWLFKREHHQLDII